jgi:predicted branched-subunit amino acid permease
MYSKMKRDSDIRAGIRAGLPLVLPTLALGVSFGVLAEPIMGKVAPIVMSLVVFSGGAQFAALSVLLSGGAAGAAIGAGMLMNARWLPMSFAVTPSLLGGKTRRAAESQAIVDASFVLASRGDGSFDRGKLIGATLTQGVGWWAGTAIGVFAGGLLGDPEKLGLDAIFPAFYLVLVVGELRHHDRDSWVVVALACAVTLALLPIAPPGIPVIAASTAALIGLRRA